MTITMRSAAPTQLRRIATGGMLALVLLGATAGLAAPASAQGQGKVNLQDLTRKVNEYEGQHRLGVAGDPSQWGALRGQDPEVPVSPNLTRKVNEYEGQHRLTTGDRGEGLDTGLLTRKVNEYEGQHR